MKRYSCQYDRGPNGERKGCEVKFRAENDSHAVFLATKLCCVLGTELFGVFKHEHDGYMHLVFSPVVDTYEIIRWS